MIELIDTKDLCDRIQRSSAWFRKWKSLGKFQEGIHYSKTSRTASILWRLDLVMDRIANWNDDDRPHFAISISNRDRSMLLC